VSIFQIATAQGLSQSVVRSGGGERRTEWQPFDGGIAAGPAHHTISSLWNFYLVRFCRRQDVSYQNLHRLPMSATVFEKAIALGTLSAKGSLFRWQKNLACA